MAKTRGPFLQDNEVVIPRNYIHSAGGRVTLRNTPEGVAVESKREKKLLREQPHWKRFSSQDPLLSLVGSLEDEASEVSRNKYTYLANAYGR